MSQYVNYVLWEHKEEIKKLLPSQVSQVMRPTSGNMWHCTRIYHENELCSKKNRINFLMKVLHWFSESNPPDNCHWAMSLPVNQHNSFRTDAIVMHAQKWDWLISATPPPWKGNKIKWAPCHSNMTGLLDISPMMFFSLEADMTGALLNSKNKCGTRRQSIPMRHPTC